eukprot:13309420-Alexandrium_andersonii.AAC.1
MHQVAGSIENPAASRLFRMPAVVRLLRRKAVHSLNFDFCAYGTAWRKRTKLVFWLWGARELG